MRRMMLVSFNKFKPEEIKKSYSMACITSYIKSLKQYGLDFEIAEKSFDLTGDVVDVNKIAKEILDLASKYEYIALSEYVWFSENINPLITAMKNSGYKGKIVLGGYQITSTPTEEKMKEYYPQADIFVKGYAEKAVEAILTENIQSGIVEREVDLSKLPSVYLTGEIDIPTGADMIRWETKRGCPMKCDYCESKNFKFKGKSFREFPKERLLAELELFGKKGVKKVNLLDSIFQIGDNYLDLIKIMVKMKTHFSMQSHFNCLETDDGNEFLDIISNKPNITLEFGIQTLQLEEMELLNRINDPERIKRVIGLLRRKRIYFEVDLIMGIPGYVEGKTPSNYSDTIKKLLSYGVKPSQIRSYQLRIARGSKMETLKNDLGIKEELNEDGVLQVSESKSFDKKGLKRMKMAKAMIENQKEIFGGFLEVSETMNINEFILMEAANDEEFRIIGVAKVLKFHLLDGGERKKPVAKLTPQELFWSGFEKKQVFVEDLRRKHRFIPCKVIFDTKFDQCLILVDIIK